MSKPYIVYSDQKQWRDPALVGGKGSQLLVLKSWGINVSDFIVLTTENKAESESEIELLLKPFLEKYKNNLFSVRSSVTAEDGVEHSFAGIFETFLNVPSSTVGQKVFQVRNSVSDPRVSSYLESKKVTVDLKIAVIVQVMVPSEKSGVSFSRSPKPPTSSVWIDAGFGLGEGIVSGTTSVDSYRVSFIGEVLESYIQNENQVLSSKEIFELSKMTLELEMKAGYPCDVEWAYAEGKWWILQLRPITQSFPKITVLVDTNLSESYPGVTSPLTCSFVQKMYAQVFREAVKSLNFSAQRLTHLEHAFPKLISQLDWHLYYNIESYYTVLGSLPGGDKNIENWHRMIGGEVYGVDAQKYILRYGKIEMIQTLWGLGRIILKQEQVFKGLVEHLKSEKKKIDEEIDSIKNPEEGWNLMDDLMTRPLGFGLTIINDLFIMIGLKVLVKILLKKGYKESDLPLLLKTDLELQSLRPLESLNHLKRKLTQKSWEILVQESVNMSWEEPYKLIYQKLRDHGEAEFARDLEKFIQQYGDRSFEELKLESLTFSQSPALLVKLIDSFYGDKNPYQGISSKPVAISLNFIQRWILQFTRRSIDWRETTRYWRGQFYHIVRRLVVKSASMMKSNDPRFNDYEIRDFFSLTSDEWLKWSRKEIKTEDVLIFMKQRSAWKHLERNYPEIYFHGEGEDYVDYKNEVSTSEIYLKGMGASPGEITGKALVLQHPEEAFMIKDIENWILVTKNTDPAWVYIMARAKGLVSEKGSLLSHTAIIGRELKLPTVVGVSNATRIMKRGEKITINGATGEVFRNEADSDK